jgi:hypothetical protein
MEILDQRYSRDDYLKFLSYKFNFLQLLTPIGYINNDVKSFEQLGTITTKDYKKLPVFYLY